LDIPKRYDEKTRQLPLEAYKDKLVEVLKLIIKDQKGIEVNMSGLRSELGEPLPTYEILALYHALGGQYITIGSDAHRKEDIYSHFYEVLRQLDQIGFEYFTIYENKEAKQISIKDTLSNHA
jgi:histidinol-phosphatase (PHP family)